MPLQAPPPSAAAHFLMLHSARLRAHWPAGSNLIKHLSRLASRRWPFLKKYSLDKTTQRNDTATFSFALCHRIVSKISHIFHVHGFTAGCYRLKIRPKHPRPGVSVPVVSVPGGPRPGRPGSPPRFRRGQAGHEPSGPAAAAAAAVCC